MICYRQAQRTQLINFANSGVLIYLFYAQCLPLCHSNNDDDGNNNNKNNNNNMLQWLFAPLELHLIDCARACIMSRRMGESGGWM
jgi:hypothetical protein